MKNIVFLSLLMIASCFLESCCNIEDECFELEIAEIKNFNLAGNFEASCSFGIFADQDIATFLLCYDTKENLIRKGVIVNIEDNHSCNSISDDVWWIPEWKANDEDSWDTINQQMYAMMEKLCDNHEFTYYKSTMFDLFCDVLRELKVEGHFGKVDESFLLLVQEGDNFLVEIHGKSLQKILSTEQWNCYLQF